MDFLSRYLPLQKRYLINDETYYSVKGKIGEGAYAYVNQVKNSHGQNFAVKRIMVGTAEQLVEANHEISILKALQSHDNILPYLGTGSRLNKRGQQEILVLMPFYASGTVQNIVDKTGLSSLICFDLCFSFSLVLSFPLPLTLSLSLSFFSFSPFLLLSVSLPLSLFFFVSLSVLLLPFSLSLYILVCF